MTHQRRRNTAPPTLKQHTKLKALAMFSIAVLISVWFTPSARGQATLKARIMRDGKLPGGASYRSLVTSKFGGRARTIPAGRIAAESSPGNRLVVVGDHPEGFGQGFIWDRKDDEILLALFINAADTTGISIENIQRGDVVKVTSAAGIASFTEDKGNPGASSLVGLVAAGAKAGAGLAGVPEAIPLISAAENFAKDKFKATNAKNKRRDAFGVDPGSGHKAKAEGGVIVCLTDAGGTFYSGESESRWIKPDGTRLDQNLPAHIFPGSAFFPMQGFVDHNTRRVIANGELFVLAWDWKFEDNAGFYKVFLHIKKGPAPPDGPIFIRQ